MECGNYRVNKFFSLPEESHNRYYIEEFNADANKYTHNVYLLTEKIKEGSKVLDIGCGSGKFGKKLKEKNCIAYGIDIDEVSIECAKKTECYKDVIQFNVMTEDIIKNKILCNQIGTFDIIILSDILEHLENPTDLLLKCYDLLTDNGSILVSVPNVAHIDISLNLLNGKFNYGDMGILDNTHLKFFTYSSFLEWIDLINTTYKKITFDVEYIGGIAYINKFIEQVKKDYKELYNLLENIKEHNALQLLFKLNKKKKKTEVINLPLLIENKNIDIVKQLGELLQGKQIDISKGNVVKSQRMVYEERIEELEISLKEHIDKVNKLEEELKSKDNHIKALEESKEWYTQEYSKLDEELKNKSNYIKALEESKEWYTQEYSKLEEESTNKNNYIKALEESKEWYNKKVEELENEIKLLQQEKTKNIEILQEQINILSESNVWYQQNNKIEEYQEAIKSLEEYHNIIQTLKEKDIQHNKIIKDLRRRLFEIENSKAWKFIKLFHTEKRKDNEITK